MPLVSKKPSIVGDRRQSVLGAERVIEEVVNGEVKRRRGRPPKIRATGVHVDPDVAYMDHRDQGSLSETVDNYLAEQEITVEPGPPIPQRGGHNSAECKYPVMQLKNPNDFFFIPEGTRAQAKSIASRCRVLGFKVTVRSNFVHRNKTGVGVWRK